MSLRAIAEEIACSPDDGWTELRLRALFSNLLTCLDRGHVGAEAVRRRMAKLAEEFRASATRNREALHKALAAAMGHAGEVDHYERPEALNAYLNCRAVSIATDGLGDCGNAWLGYPADAKVIAAEFAKGRCRDWVGLEGKPVWITPYVGELQALCEEAMGLGPSSPRRGDILARVMGMLGLSHFRATEGVLAFITRETIGNLTFRHPVTLLPSAPVGSTVIEARTHPRFRPWPQLVGTDPYGRTYELDAPVRNCCHIPHHYGAPEATRPRIPMEDFEHCIYLGAVSDHRYEDKDEAYLDEIGARASSVDLLNALAEAVSL